MILLYASPHEVKYVDYKYKFCIGVGAKGIEEVSNVIALTNHVILFGSSGITNRYKCCITDWDLHKWEYDRFIIPTSWNGIKVDGVCCTGFTSRTPVKEQWKADWLYSRRVAVVDQESYHVAKVCQKLGIKFTSVRYIIDRCHLKCMPMGINHFWRMYQHKRMQLKFNEWLKERNENN